MTEDDGGEYVLIILADNEVEIARHQMTEMKFIKASVGWTKTDKVTFNSENERPE